MRFGYDLRRLFDRYGEIRNDLIVKLESRGYGKAEHFRNYADTDSLRTEEGGEPIESGDN